jgi:glucose-1-phosphate adenylyltransferase
MGKTVALILAGGKGQRMGMLCYLRPKPALPFAGKFRVIDFSLSNCIHSGISDIGVLVDYHRSYMSDYLQSWASVNRNYARLDILPPFSGSYAGTADAVYQNLAYLKKQGVDTVMVLAGDHIYKMDYRKMIAFHQAMKANVTIGVVKVQPEERLRFGTVTVDAVGRIQKFVEKSLLPQSDLASMGIYVFNLDILVKCLTDDAADIESTHDFGYSILPRIVKDDRVFAYRYSGYWQDIGTTEAYYHTNMELLVNKPCFNLNGDWEIISERLAPSVHMENGQRNIVNSLISPGCVVRGRVENSVLSPGVHVAEDAVVRNSIVMADVTIGYHSIVDKCIFDEGAKIGRYCYVGFGADDAPGDSGITLIGKEVIVPDGTAIGRKCKVLHRVGPHEFSKKLVTAGTILAPL